MFFHTLRFLFFIIALSSLSAAQDTPVTFKSKSELVIVHAVVSKGGEAVRGLTKDDFILLHDGKPEKIAAFEEIDNAALKPEELALPPHTVQNYVSPKAQGDVVLMVLDLDWGWLSNNRIRVYS